MLMTFDSISSLLEYTRAMDAEQKMVQLLAMMSCSHAGTSNAVSFL